MELNCRVRNSQESVKDILKRQVLNLKRYDPEITDWETRGSCFRDPRPIAGMKKFDAGDYLFFDDVINLFG